MMRRLIALICIALVVFTTVGLGAPDHFSDVLAPLWAALFPVLALVIVRRRIDCGDEQPASLFSPLAPRAPPALPVLG